MISVYNSSYERWGFGLNWSWQRDRLVDPERMLMILNGHPMPDSREDVTHCPGNHIHENRHNNRYEDEMLPIKYFHEGTAHTTFKRPRLIDQLNNIIAKGYSGMLKALR